MNATESHSTALQYRETPLGTPGIAGWTVTENNDKRRQQEPSEGTASIIRMIFTFSINTSRCVLADSYHKTRATGGKKAAIRKRKYGSSGTNTKIGGSRIFFVRTRGGNRKIRALSLDSGNFALALEGTARFIDVVYWVVYNA